MFPFNINLYNPSHLGFEMALIVSFLLGIVHGITPDEHTWPITFSYAIGTRSRKKGLKTGLIFALGFTLQRTFMSEIAFFALAGIFMTALVFGFTYVFVGIAMFLAGLYLISNKKYFHWHYIEEKLDNILHLHKGKKMQVIQKEELEHKINPIECIECQKPIPTKLAFIHGLVAGFGFGAFALIIYTVIAPGMPNAYVAWLPGFLFGLGTMTMQIIFGLGAGSLLIKMKGVGEKGLTFIARNITKDILYYGGIIFIIAGLFIILFPNILNYGISTGIEVHNLHNLSIGFFIVIFIVVGITIISFIKSLRILKKINREHNVT